MPIGTPGNSPCAKKTSAMNHNLYTFLRHDVKLNTIDETLWCNSQLIRLCYRPGSGPGPGSGSGPGSDPVLGPVLGPEFVISPPRLTTIITNSVVSPQDPHHDFHLCRQAAYRYRQYD